MTFTKAHAIFVNIDSEEYTVDEKVEAVLQVAEMPTHMSIKKDAMVKVIRRLLNLAFDIVDRGEE